MQMRASQQYYVFVAAVPPVMIDASVSTSVVASCRDFVNRLNANSNTCNAAPTTVDSTVVDVT